MTPANRLLFAHLARALARYVPEAQREARANGSTPPAELLLLAEFFADCASARPGATEDAPIAGAAQSGHMTTSVSLLTKREVASALGVSVRQVERLIAASAITAVAVGGAVRVRRSDLEHYIEHLEPTRSRSFRDDIASKDTA